MSTLQPFRRDIRRMQLEDILNRIRGAVSGEISFSDLQGSYCVGMVDVVNSTKITAHLKDSLMCQYYSIFLNSMSEIAKEFGAKIVKNVGDSLLYYFPKTCDAEDINSLQTVLECCVAMMESHSDINHLMAEHGLPSVHYRISSDYGRICIAKSSSLVSDDIFGPTVSICSKINRLAMPNETVIGGDLYQVARQFAEYRFSSLLGFSIGSRLDYPVYSLSRRMT